MKNNNGFTLIELIVVIVIIGVILVFTIPNVTSTIERSKKEQVIEDAKSMIEKAKNYFLSDQIEFPIDDNEVCITLNQIDPTSTIRTSPFGGTYNGTTSQVCVKKEKVVETKEIKKYEYYVEINGTDVKLERSKLKDLSGSNKYIKVTVK